MHSKTFNSRDVATVNADALCSLIFHYKRIYLRFPPPYHCTSSLIVHRFDMKPSGRASHLHIGNSHIKAADLNVSYFLLRPSLQGADIAIGSLTVTSARENVVDFTSSFMDFTMAILMKKPKSHGHGNFVFLRPFTFGMWISILVAVSWNKFKRAISTCFLSSI